VTGSGPIKDRHPPIVQWKYSDESGLGHLTKVVNGQNDILLRGRTTSALKMQFL
jgi:hypothetical protein